MPKSQDPTVARIHHNQLWKQSKNSRDLVEGNELFDFANPKANLWCNPFVVLPTLSWLLDGLGPEAHETYILEGPCSRSAGGLGSNIGGPNEPIYDKISVKKKSSCHHSWCLNSQKNRATFGYASDLHLWPQESTLNRSPGLEISSYGVVPWKKKELTKGMKSLISKFLKSFWKKHRETTVSRQFKQWLL